MTINKTEFILIGKILTLTCTEITCEVVSDLIDKIKVLSESDRIHLEIATDHILKFLNKTSQVEDADDFKPPKIEERSNPRY